MDLPPLNIILDQPQALRGVTVGGTIVVSTSLEVPNNEQAELQVSETITLLPGTHQTVGEEASSLRVWITDSETDVPGEGDDSDLANGRQLQGLPARVDYTYDAIDNLTQSTERHEDASGNPVKDVLTIVDWNVEGKVLWVDRQTLPYDQNGTRAESPSAHKTLRYSYDASGNRVQKLVSNQLTKAAAEVLSASDYYPFGEGRPAWKWAGAPSALTDIDTASTARKMIGNGARA